MYSCLNSVLEYILLYSKLSSRTFSNVFELLLREATAQKYLENYYYLELFFSHLSIIKKKEEKKSNGGIQKLISFFSKKIFHVHRIYK